MIPKEKAQQLVDKFEIIVHPFIDVDKRLAKSCAVKCVDEIISALWIATGVDYWNEVKAEIYNVQPGDDVQCGVGKNNI